MPQEAKQGAVIGVVTVSDRASLGLYPDESGPAIVAFLERAVTTPAAIVKRIIPDGFESVRDYLIDLADGEGCDLILTTGGTGPSPRDLTPEATEAAAPRVLPGFGELMRARKPETSADRDPLAADRSASRPRASSSTCPASRRPSKSVSMPSSRPCLIVSISSARRGSKPIPPCSTPSGRSHDARRDLFFPARNGGAAFRRADRRLSAAAQYPGRIRRAPTASRGHIG